MEFSAHRGNKRPLEGRHVFIIAIISITPFIITTVISRDRRWSGRRFGSLRKGVVRRELLGMIRGNIPRSGL